MADALASPKLLKIDVPKPDRLALNKGNGLLAVGSSNENVAVILDLADGKEVARLGDEFRLRDIPTFEFFEDKLLVIRHKPAGACVFFDVHKREVETVYTADGEFPQGATIDPTGKLLAIGLKRQLVLYDLKRRKVRWRFETRIDGSASRPVFSPGGRYVAGDFMLYKSGGLVIVWDTADGKRWRTLEVPGMEPTLAFRGDTTAIVVGEEGMRLYEPDKGDEPAATFPRPSYVTAASFRDGGKLLAAIGREGLVVFDSASGKEKRVVRPDKLEIGYSVPSPDWSLIASVTRDGIVVWPSGLGQ